MELSNLDLANIQKEIDTATSALKAAQAALPTIAAAALAKQLSSDNTKMLWTESNDNRVLPYEVERSSLDGNLATPITIDQVETAAKRTEGNLFFPIDWVLPNAKLIPSANGSPFTTNSSNETVSINQIIKYKDLLLNGQSSGVGSDLLFSSYSPGSATITVENGGQTVGSYLLISGSGTSAFVKVTAIVPNGPNYDISIQEELAPAGVIADGGDVVSNFPGFTNSERQSLTSGSYQAVLNFFTSQINIGITQWNSTLAAQLIQLNLNNDTATSQITSAKNNVNSAQSSIATWQGYPNTGVGSKYSDVGLNFITPIYTNRLAAVTARVSEIQVALGSVTQDSLGNYSGSGGYLTRFRAINSLINGANGAMYEAHGATTVQKLFESKTGLSLDKVSLFKDLFG